MTDTTDGLGNPLTDPFSLRLIFLDIDEVLTSSRTMMLTGRTPYIRETSCERPYIEYKDSLDQGNLIFLDYLCKAAGAKIIISSAWREGYTTEQLREIFSSTPIGQHIIGRTGHGAFTRGGDIQEFLDRFSGVNPDPLEPMQISYPAPPKEHNPPYVIENYVIFDDRTDGMREHKRHFIQVNPVDGLLLSQIVQAGKLLIKDDRFSTLNLHKMKGIIRVKT